MSARRVAIQVLPAITSVLLIAATLTAYAWRVVFDSGQFSRRATSALQDPTVREAIANRVTDELVRRHPDLLAARPALESAVSGVVGGDAFGSLFRSGVGDVHRAVLRGDEDTVTLTVRDVGVLAAEALRVLRPELATELEARESAALLDYAFDTDLVRVANDVRLLAYVLALLAVAAAAALVFLAEDRRAAVARLGFTVLVSGAVIVVAQAVAGVLVLDRFEDPDARAAATAVWDAYLGDLRTTGWLLAGAGAVLAAAARSLIRPVAVEEPLRRVWRAVVTEPGSVRWRAVRGVALVALGVLVIVLPEAVLQLALTLVGVYALYKGLEAILRLVNGPVAERPPRRIAVAAVAVVLLMGAGVAYFAGGGIDEPAPAIAAGCEELCDRPLDELTLPATHNSMSVPLPGWYASLQGHPIDRQLADGIRGLLLDTHYAERLDNGRIRTYFESPQAMRQQIAEDGVSEESAAAALRLRARLGYPRRRRARHVPVPHVLRVGCHAAGRRPRRHPRLPRHASRRGPRDRQPGLRHAEGFRGRARRGRPLEIRARAATARGGLADAGAADRARPAAARAGREPGGRGSLVPARLRAADPGDAVHVQAHRRAHGPRDP